MAVVADLAKVKVTMKLNDGLRENGSVQTINQSLGSLDVDRYDDQKAMNIVALLKPCFAKEVYETIKTEESVLSTSD